METFLRGKDSMNGAVLRRLWFMQKSFETLLMVFWWSRCKMFQNPFKVKSCYYLLPHKCATQLLVNRVTTAGYQTLQRGNGSTFLLIRFLKDIIIRQHQHA